MFVLILQFTIHCWMEAFPACFHCSLFRATLNPHVFFSLSIHVNRNLILLNTITAPLLSTFQYIQSLPSAINQMIYQSFLVIGIQ